MKEERIQRGVFPKGKILIIFLDFSKPQSQQPPTSRTCIENANPFFQKKLFPCKKNFFSHFLKKYGFQIAQNLGWCKIRNLWFETPNKSDKYCFFLFIFDNQDVFLEVSWFLMIISSFERFWVDWFQPQKSFGIFF